MALLDENDPTIASEVGLLENIWFVVDDGIDTDYRTCLICGAVVRQPFMRAHRDWHSRLANAIG
jgi:hypothetical protein